MIQSSPNQNVVPVARNQDLISSAQPALQERSRKEDTFEQHLSDASTIRKTNGQPQGQNRQTFLQVQDPLSEENIELAAMHADLNFASAIELDEAAPVLELPDSIDLIPNPELVVETSIVPVEFSDAAPVDSSGELAQPQLEIEFSPESESNKITAADPPIDLVVENLAEPGLPQAATSVSKPELERQAAIGVSAVSNAASTATDGEQDLPKSNSSSSTTKDIGNGAEPVTEVGRSPRGSSEPAGSQISNLVVANQTGDTPDFTTAASGELPQADKTTTSTGAESNAAPSFNETIARSVPNSSGTPNSQLGAPTAELSRMVREQAIEALANIPMPASGSESKNITINLNPAELGRLTLQVGWENDLLRAHIIASEQVANELLNRDKNLILGILEENGIEVDSFQISHDGANQSKNDAEHNPAREHNALSTNDETGQQVVASSQYQNSGQGSVVNIIA
ncbi:MAG: flagellar hook-length control protein FliK [Mariniblastus sp.]